MFFEHDAFWQPRCAKEWVTPYQRFGRAEDSAIQSMRSSFLLCLLFHRRTGGEERVEGLWHGPMALLLLRPVTLHRPHHWHRWELATGARLLHAALLSDIGLRTGVLRKRLVSLLHLPHHRTRHGTPLSLPAGLLVGEAIGDLLV